MKRLAIRLSRNLLYLSEKVYLLCNGWAPAGSDCWEDPEKDRDIRHGHAVNSQKYRDNLKRLYES